MLKKCVGLGNFDLSSPPACLHPTQQRQKAGKRRNRPGRRERAVRLINLECQFQGRIVDWKCKKPGFWA
jgi:hypothetical protein